MKRFFSLLGFSLLLSCHSSREAGSKTEVKQGISGHVRERTGNQMPSPDAPGSEGKAVVTKVYVYEATDLSQVERVGTSSFYHSIKTKLLKTADSDENGFFSVELPAGNYSLFTMVDGKFYANSFDSRNNIAPVTVEKNKCSQVNITISAKASY
jgi:hypothetical protein